MPSFTRAAPDAEIKNTHATGMPCGVPRPAQAKEREVAAKRRERRKALEAEAAEKLAAKPDEQAATDAEQAFDDKPSAKKEKKRIAKQADQGGN